MHELGDLGTGSKLNTRRQSEQSSRYFINGYDIFQIKNGGN